MSNELKLGEILAKFNIKSNITHDLTNMIYYLLVLFRNKKTRKLPFNRAIACFLFTILLLI